MKHLLSVDDLDRAALDHLLDLTETFSEVISRRIPKVPALRGRTVATVFFESSTRTRLSFETAAKRLSADTMTFTATSSSLSKGESLRDTVLTLEAMGVDAMVVRHASAGAADRVAGWIEGAVINAGDGWHEHPTQALLDCFTLRRHWGDFSGKRIAIVGDVAHSRVARSNILAFTLLGAEVVLVAPRTLLPPHMEGWPVTVAPMIDEVLAEVDALYLLRMQLERQESSLVPSLREYTSRFGLTSERLGRLRPDTLILHPGPMNRGVEISAEAADHPNSVVTDQVANGVAVRMAVLFEILSGDPTPRGLTAGGVDVADGVLPGGLLDEEDVDV